MRRIVLCCVFLGSVVLIGAAHAANIYYVQSVKAKVLSAPSFRASMLGEASKGTKLTAVGKEGNWIRVSYYGKDGYVSTLLVTPYPPLARTGLIKADESEFQQGVRRRASAYTSAAAARGLAADDRRRLGSDEKSDYAGLEKMEAFNVTDAELMWFMEGGK